MKNIQEIPTEELLKDRQDSIHDASVCRQAIKIGITSYSGGSVLERAETNERIVLKIDEELKRRGVA